MGAFTLYQNLRNTLRYIYKKESIGTVFGEIIGHNRSRFECPNIVLSLVLNAQATYGRVRLCKSRRFRKLHMGTLPIVIFDVSMFYYVVST